MTSVRRRVIIDMKSILTQIDVNGGEIIKSFTLRLTEEQHEKLEEGAKVAGLSKNDFLRHLINKYEKILNADTETIDERMMEQEKKLKELQEGLYQLQKTIK